MVTNGLCYITNFKVQFSGGRIEQLNHSVMIVHFATTKNRQTNLDEQSSDTRDKSHENIGMNSPKYKRNRVKGQVRGCITSAKVFVSILKKNVKTLAIQRVVSHTRKNQFPQQQQQN